MTDLDYLPQANPGASYECRRAGIDAAVARVLASGRYVLGPEVAAFESEFADYLGVPCAVGVGNGTDAIELALRACGIGVGQAVLAPSHTAVATVAAIERTGARPALIDVDPQSFTITADGLEAALASRSDFGACRPAAVICVHLYGCPADAAAIRDVARRHGLPLIEDCAQAHGARLAGRRVGTFGDLAAFSFYPTKNLAAFGDGGLVAAADGQFGARLRGLREYGWTTRSVSEFAGVNSRLDELQAAVLRVKLPHLDRENQRRRDIARRYSAGLDGIGLVLPNVPGDAEHVFHQYVVRVAGRDELRAFLERRGIGTAIHYPVPVHRQPAYAGRGLAVAELPATERLCEEIVSLPIWPQLADADVDRVIAAIRDWAASRRAAPKGRRA